MGKSTKTVEPVEKPKRKPFTDKYTEILREFMKQNEKSSEPKPLTKCFKVFAQEHGFSDSQVQRKYYDKINNKKKDNEIVFEENSKTLAETNCRNSDLNQSYDSLESSSDHSSKTSCADGNTVQYEREGILEPFTFEFSNGHVFLFRYPSHLKFSFVGVFKKERKFVIKVETTTTVTINDCARMCHVVYKLVGGVAGGEKARYVTELSHFIPKGSDLKKFKCGSVCYGGARWYIVLFEKKTNIILPVDEFDYT